jgi:hypothetical protein
MYVIWLYMPNTGGSCAPNVSLEGYRFNIINLWSESSFESLWSRWRVSCQDPYNHIPRAVQERHEVQLLPGPSIALTVGGALQLDAGPPALQQPPPRPLLQGLPCAPRWPLPLSEFPPSSRHAFISASGRTSILAVACSITTTRRSKPTIIIRY